METLKAWWARVQETSLWRAWKRYGDSRGNLLAGGVGYFAFFSIFPALALAFAVFGLVLRDQPGLLDDLRGYVDEALPGFVRSEQNPQGIIELKAPSGATLSITGLVGLAGLLIAGLGWLSALRDGIRAIFGVAGAPGNIVLAKLRDLGVLLVIGLGVLVSVVISTVAHAVAGQLAELVGIGSQGWLISTVGVVVQALLNTGVIALLLRVLSGVPLPWPGLRNGALFGGIGLTLLQLFGTRLIASTTGDPLFAGFALVVGLLVFLNLISRVILISAAWAANDLDTASGADLSRGQEAKLVEGPEERPLTTLRERTDAGLPTFGQAAADRTSIAAGAVLGVTGAIALGTLARGIRSLLRRH